MDLASLSRTLAGAALLFSAAAFARLLVAFSRLGQPADRAAPRGSAAQGVLYAYTLGMAPWAKESTRRHWLAYLRGIAFHLGIFLGLGLLLASPWLGRFPAGLRLALAAGAGLGCLLGLVGLALRFIEPNLKALSTPDDYAAVTAVSLFVGAGGLAAALPAWMPLFHLLAAAMLVYAPFSKIRHCAYYAYSRLFFGRAMGRRGVLPHSQQAAAHGMRAHG